MSNHIMFDVTETYADVTNTCSAKSEIWVSAGKHASVLYGRRIGNSRLVATICFGSSHFLRIDWPLMPSCEVVCLFDEAFGGCVDPLVRARS